MRASVADRTAGRPPHPLYENQDHVLLLKLYIADPICRLDSYVQQRDNQLNRFAVQDDRTDGGSGVGGRCRRWV